MSSRNWLRSPPPSLVSENQCRGNGKEVGINTTITTTTSESTSKSKMGKLLIKGNAMRKPSKILFELQKLTDTESVTDKESIVSSSRPKHMNVNIDQNQIDRRRIDRKLKKLEADRDKLRGRIKLAQQFEYGMDLLRQQNQKLEAEIEAEKKLMEGEMKSNKDKHRIANLEKEINQLKKCLEVELDFLAKANLKQRLCVERSARCMSDILAVTSKIQSLVVFVNSKE